MHDEVDMKKHGDSVKAMKMPFGSKDVKRILEKLRGAKKEKKDKDKRKLMPYYPPNQKKRPGGLKKKKSPGRSY